MPDPIKRTETTYIDEVRRTSNSAAQWLLERRNMAGTHPISHNNKLTFLVGGEEAFADIANSIIQAKKSIDICCWGFDPGMELVRKGGGAWPRGVTYGDLLIAAGKRGVRVRLMVWYDSVAVHTKNPRNMPGHTHDIDPRHRNRSPSERYVNAPRCLAQAQTDTAIMDKHLSSSQVTALARRRYCMNWYEAAFDNKLANIEVRKRSGDAKAIVKSLASESHPPSDGNFAGPERIGMVHFGTHHQKPILIDLFDEDGIAACGYIMGLNSLTEYWDSAAHLLDDSRREYEHAIGVETTPGCLHVRPFRDYACRIDGGRALLAIHHNFITAWERIAPSKPENLRMPETCLRKARPGDSTVQVLRTQPEEGDKSVKEAYFQATDNAALGTGYIYLENQYFQYTEWAQRLIATRKKVMKDWTTVCVSCGKTAREMPILHVFIVIPVPELEGMIPRTYETLATLGQQEGMKGQCDMIRIMNEGPSTKAHVGVGQPIKTGVREIAREANRIAKPDAKMLETGYGLKICTAMLNSCDFSNGKWRYREIYIHSKLLLIDDTYIALGSANLNQRSMAVDSEINLAAIAPEKASALRRRIWSQLGGNDLCGGSGSRAEVEFVFKKWKDRMKDNESMKAGNYPISGHLLPLNDTRSSIVRLG